MDGVVFNPTRTRLVLWPAGKAGNYTIPDSVTEIGDLSFAFCSALTGVTIGNSVTRIGGSAFASCSGLTSVTLPASVTSIGGGRVQFLLRPDGHPRAYGQSQF